MGLVRNTLVMTLVLAGISLAQAADEAQVKRGEYLARAADCMACHTAEGGAPFAGGLPIHSPFGTIYGTNITSDKQYGIGSYTPDEFFAATVSCMAIASHPRAYFVSLCRVDFLQNLQYLLSSMRSGSFFLFLFV